MPQSVVVYSEIIPTIFAVIGLYFLGSGILDYKRLYAVVGIILFILAVLLPFIILTNLI